MLISPEQTGDRSLRRENTEEITSQLPERLRTRRWYLTVVAAGAFAGLAGCVGSADSDNTPGSNETASTPVDGDEADTANETTTEDGSSTGSEVAWPMFQADAANTGYPPINIGPTSGQEKWHFQTDGFVSSSPAVVEGTVYVSSMDHNVYALDASDGSEKWRFQTGGSISASPAVVEGTVYVSSEDKNVYALAADDGSEQWRFEIETGFESDSLFWASATVVDGTVYVVNTDGTVYALSAETGDEQWRFEADVTARARTTPAVVEDTVYIGHADQNVYALSTADGTEQWRFETGDVVHSSPAVAEGTVYVGSSTNNVYALAADDGSEQWCFQTDHEVSSSPAIADGTVYVGSLDSNMYALSADDGTEQWRFKTDSGVATSAAVVDGTVYVGSNDGNLYALSADDGTEEWRFETEFPLDSSPVVADGTLYVGSREDRVYALGLNDNSGGSEADSTERRFVFHELFVTGLNDWNVGEPPYKDLPERNTPGDGKWTDRSGGSVHLQVDGAPSTVTVHKQVGPVPAETQVTATYSPKRPAWGNGNVVLEAITPEGETIRLDIDNQDGSRGGGSEQDGVLSGTVPRDLPAGTAVYVKLVVWPGDTEIWVNEVVGEYPETATSSGN